MARFDASVLTSEQLVLLEATLRVQLQVVKWVRLSQMTTGTGMIFLSGGLSALPSSISIISSTNQRRKYKKRRRACLKELERRELQTVSIDEVIHGKRAWILACGTGLVVCVVSFAADLFIHEAVFKVLTEYLLMELETKITGHLEDQISVPMAGLAIEKLRGMTTGLEKEAKLKRSQTSSDAVSAAMSELPPSWTIKPMKKAQSVPAMPLPDLFGEREAANSIRRAQTSVDEDIPDLFGERDETSNPVSGDIYVRRTNSFSLFGECYELRFAAAESDKQAATVVDNEHGELVQRRTIGAVTIIGDDSLPPEILHALQGNGLYTSESSSFEDDDDDDINAHNLFGTADELQNLEADNENYNLFGVPVIP
ncbi:hypothetical protein Poli38472_001849 [Pythium oligandrum]|uniref:Uncharacterized protein n=1 Tax=Pythium oligandrum TaxID=41045 RepID=A0A8K1CVG8_PYTOL|nr:hypothetical protein Poli38472_001849 [Pythium oligandrum]|eukprot:TMW69693.1 hypothetical protein Poli38472_001849 [Pythium oligandrum]